MSRRIYAGAPTVKQIGAKLVRSGYRFVPLVIEQWNVSCAIDILFLRRDATRSVVHGGDIDNRLKTLFDATKVPANANELGGYLTPAGDEDPFYCLLEDDKLITEVQVTTDALLAPSTPTAVKLIIRVNVRPFQLSELNSDFA